LEHKNRVHELWLSLDENIGDWITTKEFIHFCSRGEDMDKISSEKQLKSDEPNENLSLVYALNLWQYIFYGNPNELMWALSSASDEGVIFRTPWMSKQRVNMKSESKIAGGVVSISPIEIVEVWEFFRRYWYNEIYSNRFGKTIEARKSN
jgi:hypothetical protein